MERRDEIAVEVMKVLLRSQLERNLSSIEESNNMIDFVRNEMPARSYEIADSMIHASEVK